MSCGVVCLRCRRYIQPGGLPGPVGGPYCTCLNPHYSVDGKTLASVEQARAERVRIAAMERKHR